MAKKKRKPRKTSPAKAKGKKLVGKAKTAKVKSALVGARGASQTAISGDDLLTLLGKRYGAQEFKGVEQQLGEKAKVSTHQSQRYACFRKHDVSLDVGEGGTIDTLFIAASSPISFPMGLVRNHTRHAVQDLLGQPAFSREQQDFAGAMGPGDVFDYPNITLAIDFSRDGIAIEQVCAMTPETAPGRKEREQTRRK